MKTHPSGKTHSLMCVFIVSAMATGFVALSTGCVNRLFFYPTRIEYRTPENIPAPVRDIYFNSPDGTRLHGWFISCTTSNALGTVVHFHGNAQNLTAHSSFVDWLPDAGFNVFLFDYRGYGRSDGSPSRQNMFEDGIAALQEVRTLPGVDTNRIFILGQSIGGTTCLAVAGSYPELRGAGLIIDSAFYSYRRIVRDKIAEIPLLSLLRVPLSVALISDSYDPAATLPGISPTPILFIHGTSDRVVPYHHSEMLFSDANMPKELITIEGGAHTSGMITQRETVIPRILDFMHRTLRPIGSTHSP